MSSPVAKRAESGCLLVVRYVSVQFVDWVHPAKDAGGTCPPGSTVVGACTVIVIVIVSLSLTPSSQDTIH